MDFKKAFYAAIFSFILCGMLFPTNPTSQLQSALTSLCVGLRDLVPVAAMLMVLLAAVIYSSGQMMGAETRARANVWATSCLTGALIGIMIAVIAPAMLDIISGQDVSGAC
ncbi:MAG: hypothetical protein WC588_04095 [Candidatus Micrarchaeia archaeon]